MKILSCHLVLGVIVALAAAAAEADENAGSHRYGSQTFYQQCLHDSQGKQWESLFNGKDLRGWKVVLEDAQPGSDPEHVFQVAEESIHVYRDTPAGEQMPFGILMTDQDYSHYRLRFEYRWGEKKFAPRENKIRDAGVLYHIVGEEKIWPTSVECQIQEGDTGDLFFVYTAGDVPVDASGRKFQPLSAGGRWKTLHRSGRVARGIKSETREHAGWNQVEIIVRGDRALHLVNGEINNYVMKLQTPAADKSLVPLTSGRIAFQCEGAEVFYRHIELLNLDEPAADEPVRNEIPSFEPASESAAPSPALPPEASLAAWEVREGFRIELAAAEPLTMDPVAIDWDSQGRLWVVEMVDYPNGLDGHGQAGGRIRILEDQDEDGQYDTSHLFIDGLNFPTGIVTYRQGIIVTAAPEILYLEDTDGDHVCDVKKVLFSGYSEGNQQLRVNGLRWGLDGWLYCASGSHVANYGKDSKIKSHLTGEQITLGSRDFRFQPATGELEPLSGPSQFGRNCDEWGNWFGVQNSFPLWHYVLEDNYLGRNPHLIAPDPRVVLTPPNPLVYPANPPQTRFHNHDQAGRFTSACSGMIYRDSLLFPPSDITHAFTCEPVHNLVQHNLLRRSGVSFKMTRDASGPTYDFLASRDPWCRPVMVRTGPDGALWIVDMYRCVIEHPHWLPQEGRTAVAPYLRAGDGRGRIYRVVPADQSPRPIPSLSGMATAELVQMLDHSNAWIRDVVKQLLLEQPPIEVQTALRQMLDRAVTPQGKLNALYTLQMFEPLDDLLLVQVLTDPNNEIRRHGLRFAEAIQHPSEELANAIQQLSGDTDPGIKLQLALSLGAWKEPFASAVITQMLTEDISSPMIRGALLSSLHERNVAQVVEAMAKKPMRDAGFRNIYKEALRISLAYDKQEPLLDAIAAQQSSDQELARAIVALGVARQVWGPSLHEAPKTLYASLPAIAGHAREILGSETSPQWLRILAVDSLFLLPDSLSADLDTARSLLHPTVSPDLQMTLLRRLGQQPRLECCELLLEGWPGYSPTMRSAILEEVLSQPAWHEGLAQALEERTVTVSEVALSLQERFLSQSTCDALRSHFQRTGAPNGNLAINAHPVDMSGGNPESGKLVFAKNCSSCHRFQNEGRHIGPSLDALTNQTPASLMEAIVRPNNSVDAKYQNYIVATKAGQVISGIITNESNNGLTILRPDGESYSVLRRDIEELRGTGKSLMPEGFDQAITPTQMVDLLAYLLQQPAK